MTKREVLEDKQVRKAYFATNFPAFFAFHFGWQLKSFHVDWLESMQSENNTFIEAFRASRKTTMARGYVVWCICYKTEPHIIVQSYERALSSERVSNIAKMLFKNSIVNDYWTLFPLETKKSELKKKSLHNFESKNGVKISSKSLGQTLRGANEYDMEDDSTARPTLLVLDDIDVDKSVKNPTIIEDNFNKITWETISALDPLHRKVIFLWNTIQEDWVVPRFRKKYKNSESRNIFHQPLFKDWENVRPEVFNDKVVRTLKDDWEISFNQNYLLVPYRWWQSIIQRSQIQTTKTVPASTDDNKVSYVIGIDPAFSLKTNSDSVWIVVTAHRGEDRYIVQVVELEGKEKDEENIKTVVANLYNRYNVSIVNVEGNNWWEIIARQLQAKGIAVNVLKSSKDKVTRLSEYQWLFTRGQVFFLPWTETLQEQLLVFPSKAKDDLVDAMVFSLDWFYSFDVVIW